MSRRSSELRAQSSELRAQSTEHRAQSAGHRTYRKRIQPCINQGKMKKNYKFCSISEILKSLLQKLQVMNNRKTRFLGFAGITLAIILISCFLLGCFTTLRNNVSTSNEVASEIIPAPAAGTKSSVTSGSGQKPSFSQLWSRSEVFMY
jgi:hypothetical protein